MPGDLGCLWVAVASFVHVCLSLLYVLDQIQDLGRVLSARLGWIHLRTSTLRPQLPSFPPSGHRKESGSPKHPSAFPLAPRPTDRSSLSWDSSNLEEGRKGRWSVGDPLSGFQMTQRSYFKGAFFAHVALTWNDPTGLL